MADLIASLQDGKLIVSESRECETNYVGSGVPVRIGELRTIDKVLSIDTDHRQYGLITPLNEVRTSGSQIFVVMRRGDVGDLMSGQYPLSGRAAYNYMSGISSGVAFLEEFVSGGGIISGVVTVEATVVGY